jgi:hypothetical protein
MPTACDGRSRVGWRGAGCAYYLDSRTHPPCARVGSLTWSDLSQVRLSYPRLFAANKTSELAEALDEGLAYDGFGSQGDIRSGLHGRSIFKFDLRATFPDQTLERNLSPHRKRIEICASIPGGDGAYLLGDGAMQIVEHEADVAADVPVQRRRIDRLPAAALASLPAQPVPDPLVNVGKCEST